MSSNSLDPDQARHIVGPDLGPNCLQRLSTAKHGRNYKSSSESTRLTLVLLL